jgi:hypothetical protein
MPRESKKSRMERAARVAETAARARSPYWRERYKAGEKPGPGLFQCPKCGIEAPPTYGLMNGVGMKVCEECRLTAYSAWMESLRAEGIWPPNEKFEEHNVKPLLDDATTMHFYIRAYDQLRATAGEPLKTMSGRDVVDLLLEVQRCLGAMEDAIERAERARAEAEASIW